MIKNFFVQNEMIPTSFGITTEKAEEIVETIKRIHDSMVVDMVHNKTHFDKTQLIKVALETCTTEAEEAYALYNIGAKVERLEHKMAFLQKRATAFGPIVEEFIKAQSKVND